MNWKSILEIGAVAALAVSLVTNAVLLVQVGELNERKLPRVVMDSYNEKRANALLDAALNARREELKQTLGKDYSILRQQHFQLLREQKALSSLIDQGTLDRAAVEQQLARIQTLECSASQTTQRLTLAALTQLTPQQLKIAAKKSLPALRKPAAKDPANASSTEAKQEDDGKDTDKEGDAR